MKFTAHIAHAVNKANQILGLIRRSFTYLDTALTKQLYTSMVQPHLEYGNVVWHPYLKKDVDLLERVQRRAILVPVLSKLSYEERLKEMDLPSLVYRRIRGDSIDIYKYLHGMYRTNAESLLPLAKSTSGVATRGHSLKLEKRHCRTQLRANTLGYRMVNFWNSLPAEVVQQSQLTPSRDIVTNAVLQSSTAWMWMKFSL